MRARAKRSICRGCIQAGQLSATNADLEFIKLVKRDVPIPPILWTKLQRSYPTYWIASHRPCSWLSAINKFQEVSWGRTPQHLRARECLTIFFSDERWHVPNFDDGSRVSWQELVFDFIAEFGIVPGFVQPGMSLSKMCSKFRTYSNKILQGVEISRYVRTTHLRCFSGGTVSGLGGRRLFKHPNVVWSLLLQLSISREHRAARSCRRPSASFTPDWSTLPGFELSPATG